MYSIYNLKYCTQELIILLSSYQSVILSSLKEDSLLLLGLMLGFIIYFPGKWLRKWVELPMAPILILLAFASQIEYSLWRIDPEDIWMTSFLLSWFHCCTWSQYQLLSWLSVVLLLFKCINVGVSQDKPTSN